MRTEASRFLGSLIASSLQVAAMNRAELPAWKRKNFFVYLDEFSSFIAEGNDTFSAILSESLKYRTGYTLVAQFIDQLDPQTRAAVFGNCGTLISMQCGIDDARLIADQLGTSVPAEAIVDLPRFHAYARMPNIDGTSQPFAMPTPVPLKQHLGRSAIVCRQSQRQHGIDANTVEQMIQAAYA